MIDYPQVAADERTTLEQFLDFHRAAVLRTLAEVKDDQAAAPVRSGVRDRGHVAV
jgi:hypothetical protein